MNDIRDQTFEASKQTGIKEGDKAGSQRGYDQGNSDGFKEGKENVS